MALFDDGRTTFRGWEERKREGGREGDRCSWNYSARRWGHKFADVFMAFYSIYEYRSKEWNLIWPENAFRGWFLVNLLRVDRTTRRWRYCGAKIFDLCIVRRRRRRSAEGGSCGTTRSVRVALLCYVLLLVTII